MIFFDGRQVFFFIKQLPVHLSDVFTVFDFILYQFFDQIAPFLLC